MTEDLSAMFRTSISYVLLSCVMLFVVVMVNIGVQRLNEVSGQTGNAIGVMEQSTLTNAVGLTMSGVSAYRIYNTYSGAVSSFEIKMKDGTTFSNMSQLMEPNMIAKKFYVNSVQIGSGMWRVVLEER